MKKRKSNNTALAVIVIFAAIAVYAAKDARAGYRYDSHGRRDPFVPLVGVAQKSARGGVKGIFTQDDVSLQGIVMGDDGVRRAIINGEVMKAGDRIDRFFVEAVEENSVKIQIDEAGYEIKLYK